MTHGYIYMHSKLKGIFYAVYVCVFWTVCVCVTNSVTESTSHQKSECVSCLCMRYANEHACLRKTVFFKYIPVCSPMIWHGDKLSRGEALKQIFFFCLFHTKQGVPKNLSRYINICLVVPLCGFSVHQHFLAMVFSFSALQRAPLTHNSIRVLRNLFCPRLLYVGHLATMAHPFLCPT